MLDKIRLIIDYLEFKFCREATRGVVWMDLENNKPIGLTSLE